MEKCPKFPPGQVVATPGALKLLHRHGLSPRSLLQRHLVGDWGDVPPEDSRENELSLKHGFRILSSYPIGDHRVWVITEADRSITTFLLPSEY
jgi:hypothetical protein